MVQQEIDFSRRNNPNDRRSSYPAVGSTSEDAKENVRPQRAAEEPKRIKDYSVIILSAHSTSDTKILGLPNFAPYSFKSASVTPLAREQAPQA
jgi:hypothetical protein